MCKQRLKLYLQCKKWFFHYPLIIMSPNQMYKKVYAISIVLKWWRSFYKRKKIFQNKVLNRRNGDFHGNKRFILAFTANALFIFRHSNVFWVGFIRFIFIFFNFKRYVAIGFVKTIRRNITEQPLVWYVSKISAMIYSELIAKQRKLISWFIFSLWLNNRLFVLIFRNFFGCSKARRFGSINQSK